MTSNQPFQQSQASRNYTPGDGMAEPFASLKRASSNFWAGHTGRECAPAATYRTVNGKQVLGRYLDPFGCQACMTWARQAYHQKLVGVLVLLGIMGGASLLDPIFLGVVLPAALIALWFVRGQYAKHFDIYYRIEEEINRTGAPVWAPFDKVRLKYIQTNPNSVWP